jgi:hypothetical protein
VGGHSLSKAKVITCLAGTAEDGWFGVQEAQPPGHNWEGLASAVPALDERR